MRWMIFSWPAKSKCSLVVDGEGEMVGNYFTCRTGRKTFEWIVTGIYFDDAESLGALLLPVLERLSGYAAE